MANNLTGDYEAVVQVSVRQINGLLATLHQNGAKGSGLSPSFPHSVANLRVGDLPKYLQFETLQFAEWLSGAVQSFQGSGGPSVTGAELAAKAPPGAAARFHAALEDIASAWTEVATPGSIRGRAEVQVSTPRIGPSPGSTSEVVVSVEIRARFIPDPGFSALPEPIHGEVQVTYQVRPRTFPDGKRVLTVEVPAQDNKIVFKDLAGLNAADVATLTARIRDAVRKEFKPAPVALPDDFQFFEFKEIGGGQALALPLQLSGAPAPPSGLASVTNPFLDANTTDFAIAVSREYVAAQFAPTLDELRQFRKDVVVEIDFLPDPTYHLSVTSVDLQFNFGSIDLIIHAKATTDNYIIWPARYPSYNNIVITQRLKLGLALTLIVGLPGPNTVVQGVTLTADDSDLTITGITGLYSGTVTSRARTEIIAERDKALPAARTAVAKAFEDTLIQLNNALVKFDNSASASYTAVEINPDGIIVRGAIDTKYHYQPQMEIGYTEDGNSFSALDCWIPGGRIANYTWYWVETPVFRTPEGLEWTIPWWGQQKSSTQPHRFTFPIPAALKGRPSWSKGVCLSIEGDQVDRDGSIAYVTGFDKSGTCEVTSHEPILVVDPLWEAVYGILWGPRPPESVEILEEAISAHFNVLAHPRPAGGLTTNALVHFAGAQSESPLETLGRALAAMRRSNVSLTVVLVMPAGTFRKSRGEVEETLGLRGERFSGPSLRGDADENQRPPEARFGAPLLITEDYGGGWTRTFDARTTPSSYLMNALGEFVWKQEERVDVEALAAAMDEYFLPAPAPRTLPLRLTVGCGERAPDAWFEEGRVLALNRLRGQHVLLNFWQSWSAPCIRELRRLQRLHEEGGGRAPVILAVNGGEERTVLAEVRRQHALNFTLIHDPGRRIAQLYGVQCWPTTVSITPDGIVDRIQFGVAHPHQAEDRGKQAP
jgi:peroxiredoxin